MKTKKDDSILRQLISEENITGISELIVLTTIKTHCNYNHIKGKCKIKILKAK